MKWKWRESEEMERQWKEIHSLHFLIFSLFPPSLSISNIKKCLILSQNVKYVTFVGMSQKNLTYAPWENDPGSSSLRESSASRERLVFYMRIFGFLDMLTGWSWNFFTVCIRLRRINQIRSSAFERKPECPTLVLTVTSLRETNAFLSKLANASCLQGSRLF